MSFKNIVGHDDIKSNIDRTVRRMLKTDWNKSKIKPPKGMLLYGQPGCGKSAIMEAIIEDHVKPNDKFKIMYLDKSTITAKSVNDTAKVVNDVFDNIKADQDHIFFLIIDEADDIMMTRKVGRAYAGELTSAMLRNIEGIGSAQNFYMIAATNYFEYIDPAILDRFDSMYEILAPGCGQRMLLIKKIIVDNFDICKVGNDDIKNWAISTVDFTGRDLTRVAQSLEEIEFDIKEANENAILTTVNVGIEITKQYERIQKSIAGSTTYRGKL